MNNNMLFLILLFVLPMVCVGQNPQAQEAQESIRFIRLAETRKNLDFEDETLLKVNDILDDYEQKRFDLVRQEAQLKRKIAENRVGDGEAQEVRDGIIHIRTELHKAEMALWDQMSALLTPEESLQLYLFYDRFQKEVYRRIRGMNQRGMKGPSNQRRPRPRR